MFIFSFIAFIRERHITYLRACLDATYRLDAALEAKLRLMSDDDIPNNEVVIPPAKVGGLQRAINYYADVIGTLVGIVLLIIVTVVWICIGPALNFNANWWLIIGTYAGLMGMNDGFVLRNVQARLLEHEEPQYARILSNDRQLLQDLNLPAPTMDAALLKTLEPTMSRRVSDKMNKICGHELMVILGVVVILGLIIGASAMGWSETGQLLCNVPPSVIETFFMIILITGHNSADAQRRLDLNQIFEVRRSLFAFAEAIDHVLCLKKREKESCGDAEGKEKEVSVV
jgi:low-affinity ferrous iron transport protein